MNEIHFGAVGALLTALVAFVTYTFSMVIRTSPRKLRAKLAGCRLELRSVSVSVSDINDRDTKGILPMYYRSAILMTFSLYALLPFSFFTAVACAVRLLTSLNRDVIPRSIFIESLIVFLVSAFLQGLMIIFVEKTKANIEEC